MRRKTRDGNHMAMEALTIHGHTTAARRGDLVRREGDNEQAIYALQSDLDQRSST
jgi:hypothetical protein